MEFLKSNLWEIKKSSALRFFGAVLAFCHSLTWLDWYLKGKLPLVYFAQSTPMCWSIWESCQQMRFLPLPAMEILFTAYLVLAILTLFVFLFTQIVGFGWFLLLLTFLVKLLFYFQDYRLSSNEHYFLLILNLAYLFIPNKASMIKYLIVSFFVASGLLKLYPQWMSGQWFEERMMVPIKLGEWFAAIGFLVETIAPMALLFRDARFFSLGFLALVIYQLFIGYIDGFFVPAIMIANLCFFLALVIERRRTESEFLYQSFIRPEPSRLWLGIGLSLFWAIQGLPFLPIANPSLRRMSETISMDPFAAAKDCQVKSFLIYHNRIEEAAPTQAEDPSLSCNSYMKFLEAKSLCTEHSGESGFRTVASFMRARSLRDPDYHSVFEVQDMCAKSVTFKTLGAN